ncbi:hypothetical protein TI06_23775, partial [Vibrio vulnificus]
PGPALVVTAQVRHQQAAARMDQAGQLFQRLRRRGEVVQDHVQHHAIGRFGGVLQGIGQFQADVAQSFFLAALA